MAEITVKYKDAQVIPEISYTPKRGDIVNIAPDGTYDNMPHLTVIKVPGVDPALIQKFMEPAFEPVLYERLLDEQKQQEKELVPDKVVSVNDKSYTVKQDFFVSVPVKKSEEIVTGKKYIVMEGQVLKISKFRRFNIPEVLMSSWFTDTQRVKTFTTGNFSKQLINELIDKSHGSVPVKDTAWKQAE